MTEIGEKVFSPQPSKDEADKEDDSQKRLKLRLLLFFDGTANNRTNVEEREENTELYQSFEDQWIKIKEYKSYQNAKTNVAFLESHLNVEKPPEDCDQALSVYIEGPGTEDREEDHRRGLGLGTGSTGIEKKVEKGIEVALFNLREVLKNSGEETTLEKLTIDLFGFSRGAAGARFCVHQLMDWAGEPLSERLENEGFPAGSVAINLVGLFDTVSSHGVSFSNDVAPLKLDAIHRARRVIQLEASEEYRKNFSLTTVASAGGRGRRICLPGAHADIGGGYRKGGERQVVYRGRQNERHADRDWLLAQGWYRPSDLTLPSSRDLLTQEIRAERAEIAPSYSKIPLALMAGFIEEEGMAMNMKKFPKLIDLNSESEELRELQDRIQAYVASGAGSTPEDWQGEDPLLYLVRHRYLHLSANYSALGMTPRLDSEGRRTRQYYKG